MERDELPAAWAAASFGDLCSIRNGYAFKSREFTDSGVPLIKQGNLTGALVDLSNCAFLPAHFLPDHPNYQVMKGDILIGMSGSLGEPSEYRGIQPALQNQRTGLLVTTPAGDRGFVRYFLQFAHRKLVEMSKGMAIQNVSAKQIESLAVGLPPLPEQERIVEKIETLFAELDKGEEALREVQKLLARYRQSVLKAAVTGSLLGGDSIGWEQVTLGSLLKDLRYGTAKKCRQDAQGTAVLRIPNVVKGSVDLGDLKFTELTEKELSKLALEVGDILIVRSNGSASLVGRGAIVTESAVGLAYAGYLIRLRLNQERIAPEFLNMVLRSPEIRARIERQAKSTSGVHNLNSEEVRAIEFLLPTLDMQVRIVEQVDEFLTKTVQAELWCEAELKRSAGLRQSILKDAFSGKLVPQDPSDEPAEKLLERIRASRAESTKLPRKKAKA